MQARPLELSELMDRQRWLIDLRWTAAAGVAIIVAALKWLVGIDLQVLPLFVIAGVIALYNLAFWFYVREQEGKTGVGGLGLGDWGRETEDERRGTGDGGWGSGVGGQSGGVSGIGEEASTLHGLPRPLNLGPGQARHAVIAANLQISLDLTALTFLLHFAGGVENPFYLYYIFHVVIASILLSRTAAYLQTTFAVALFSSLAVLEYLGLLPHVGVPELQTDGQYRQSVFVIAVVTAFVTALYFAVYMATTIVGSLRAREAQVMDLRVALESEQSALREAYGSLQEVELSKSRYMRKVSHELRAPLSSVQSLITVVLEGLTGPIPDKTREILRRASVRTKELLDLVADLLVLSRSREVKAEATRQRIVVAEIASRIIPLFQAQAIDKGVDMSVDIEPDLPALLADPEGMEELLSNLISNAIKYTPAGGKVWVSLKNRDGQVVITVSDTGIGIEPEEIPHIFEEFHRTKRAREAVQEGTGLGLAIVKAIVNAHNGGIEVHSRPGEGTTFVVTLPGVEGGGQRVEGKDDRTQSEGGGGEEDKREEGEARLESFAITGWTSIPFPP